jgi:hypothetical protein
MSERAMSEKGTVAGGSWMVVIWWMVGGWVARWGVAALVLFGGKGF